MSGEILQEVVDLLLNYLPKKWKSFALYSEFVGSMSMTKFYIDSGKGYKDCYQFGYDRQSLIELFFKIEAVLLSERNQLKGKKRWNVFTMFVDSEGNLEFKLDYTDISKTYVNYCIEWEKENIYNIK